MTVERIIQHALNIGRITQSEVSKLLYLTQIYTLSEEELHLIQQLLESLRNGQVHLQVTTPRTRSRLIVPRR